MLALCINANGQNSCFTVSKDPKNDEVVFSGRVTFSDLNSEPSFTWLKDGRDEYKPDDKATTFLKEHLQNYTFTIFMGTWCSDSQDMLPRLEKVLQTVGYPESSVTMYGVDRTKKTKNGESKKSRINLVPTVILQKDGKEIGRITETAHKSVEADITSMIKKDMAKTRH